MCKDSGRLSCGSPHLVVLGIFGALTKLKSATNDLPYASQVALGLFGQCNAQASKVAHFNQTVFYFISVHSKVIFNPPKRKKDNEFQSQIELVL